MPDIGAYKHVLVVRKQLEEAETAKTEQTAATEERQKRMLLEKLLLLKNTSLDENNIRMYLNDIKKKYNA